MWLSLLTTESILIKPGKQARASGPSRFPNSGTGPQGRQEALIVLSATCMRERTRRWLGLWTVCTAYVGPLSPLGEQQPSSQVSGSWKIARLAGLGNVLATSLVLVNERGGQHTKEDGRLRGNELNLGPQVKHKLPCYCPVFPRQPVCPSLSRPSPVLPPSLPVPRRLVPYRPT